MKENKKAEQFKNFDSIFNSIVAVKERFIIFFTELNFIPLSKFHK